MIPPLVSLALNMAPELARFLFGEHADATATAVARLVQSVTGTPEPEAAKAVLARDAGKSEALRVQLARFAAESEQSARTAELAYFGARLAELAKPWTPQAPHTRTVAGWGAPVVSLLVLATFGAVMLAAMTKSLPAGSETAANLLLGNLAAMTSAVVSYWVGSSAGSAAKTELMARGQAPSRIDASGVITSPG